MPRPVRIKIQLKGPVYVCRALITSTPPRYFWFAQYIAGKPCVITLDEWLKRYLQLNGRLLKLKVRWELTKAFTPFKAICARKKFAKVARLIQELVQRNNSRPIIY